MSNVSVLSDVRLVWRSFARAFWHHPLLHFGIVGCATLTVVLATQVSFASPMTRWVEVLALVVTMFFLAHGSSTLAPAERLFWRLWILALACWTMTRVIALSLPSSARPAAALLITDSVQVLFYLALSIAALLTPERSQPTHIAQGIRRLQWTGLATLAFGLALYFWIIPLRAQTTQSAADAYMVRFISIVGLLLGVTYLVLALRRDKNIRWRAAHGLLAAGLILWVFGGVSWYLALAAIAAAARFRHWLPDQPQRQVSHHPAEPNPSNLLVPAAIVLPLVHLTACGFDLIDTTLRPMREMLVLFGTAGVGALAIAEHRLLGRASWVADRRSERFAEAAFEGIAEIADGRIVGANHQLAAMFGYAAGELEGRAFRDLIGPVHRQGLAKRLSRARRRPIELQGLRRDRSTFRAEVRTRGYADAEARTQAIAVCDITDRLDLEAKLQQAQKAEIAGRLVSGLARDFNNQLTVILGRSELLLCGEKNASHKDIEEIRLAAETAANVTRQLLVFAGPQQPVPRIVDLADILDSVADSFLERVVPLEATLFVERSSESLPVHADRHQLEQLILGLSLRALDGLPTGADLHVGATRTASGPSTRNGSVSLEIRVTRKADAPPTDPRADRQASRSSTSLATQESALAAMLSIVNRNGATLRVEDDSQETLRYVVRFPSPPASAEPQPTRS